MVINSPSFSWGLPGTPQGPLVGPAPLVENLWSEPLVTDQHNWSVFGGGKPKVLPWAATGGQRGELEGRSQAKALLHPLAR